jgi:hypothetical protein
MTALDRARGWFIAPPPQSTTASGWSAPPSASRGDDRSERSPRADDPTAPERSRASGSRADDRPAAEFSPPSASGVDSRAVTVLPECLPPTASRGDDPAAAPKDRATVAPPEPSASEPHQRLASLPAPDRASSRPRRGKRLPRPAPRSHPGESTTDGGWRPPVPGEWITAPPAAAIAVTSAAVLGRAGEVEPVAAALALALRLQTRAKAAAVAVVGAVPREVEVGSSGAAARRLGARLEAHGLDPRVRGRLAWVELDSEDPQFASAARRVTLVAAPAVLAVTTARNVAVDEALNEQDLLVIVTAEPEGPLAQLAAAGLASVPILTVRPLGRGPARALARAGVRSARPMRQLLTTVPEVAE